MAGWRVGAGRWRAGARGSAAGAVGAVGALVPVSAWRNGVGAPMGVRLCAKKRFSKALDFGVLMLYITC